MHLEGVAVAYVVAGATLLLALIVPTLVRRAAVSSPLVLLAVGVLLGVSPITDGLSLDPEEHRAVVEHVAELTVLVALMGVGLALDRPLRLRDADSRRAWSPTWRLLLVTMPLTIGAIALLGVWAGLTLPIAVLLGAALAPTDPVLASDVQVAGPDVEARGEEGEEPHPDERSEVRFALTSEAGLNDGLAFPFVYGAVILAGSSTLTEGLVEWVAVDVVWRIVAGVVVGVLLGMGLGRLAFRARSEAARIAERGDPLLALAALLAAYGAAELVGGYGFLAVFFCALALREAERGHEYHRGMHELVERLELLLTLLGLLYLGIAIGRGLLGALTVQGVLIGVALVLVVRPLAGWLALSLFARPDQARGGLSRGERAAVAFFGVRGVGSVFYLAYGLGVLDTDKEDWLWATVGFTIVLSVVVHGVLATPVMNRVDDD